MLTLYSNGDDVFLGVPTPTLAHSALSPTAAAFTPRAGIPEKGTQFTVPQASNAAHISHLPAGFQMMEIGHNSAVSSLVASSVPETPTFPHAVHQARVAPAFGAVGQPVIPRDRLRRSTTVFAHGIHWADWEIREGVFTDVEPASRTFRVSNMASDTDLIVIAEIYAVRPHHYPP